MEAKSSEKMNDKEFEKLQSEITDRMNRLLSASDFLCEESSNDMKFLSYISYELTDSQKTKVGDQLATLGVTKLFLQIWEKYFKMDFLNNNNRQMYNQMERILCTLCNSTDRSTALCVKVFESDLHKVVLNFLKTDYLDPSKTGNRYCKHFVTVLLEVLHNILQKVPESSHSLREQKALDVFQRFRKSPSKEIVCRALILQGYIVAKEENELLKSEDSTFIFLKDLLEKALMPSNSERKANGLAPIEVISALNLLAVNDNNKTKIVSAGILPFYVKLLQPQCSEEEQVAAAEGLWTLAFKCNHEIENEDGCVSALKKLTKVKSERLKRLAAGVLWTLDESKRKENPCRQISRSSQEGQKHVFISYQWDSQPMIEKLVSSLKEEGFQVWVDFDNMSGSILEAMAKAVEEAAVVIVCLSQKYQESPNCRTEAEYTFRRHKDILPLRLQSHYWPDGWLGALIGSRYMHDFTSYGKYSESIRKVIRELGERGKATEHEEERLLGSQLFRSTLDESDSKVDTVTQTSSPTTGCSRGRISTYATWTSAEVVQWLQENNLEMFQYWLRDFDGTLLIEFKAMLDKAPEAFYSMLRERFNIKDMLLLIKALKQL